MLQHPEMEKRLREELEPLYANDPDRIPTNRELEKLPYLTGCVKEGLRYVFLVSALIPKIGGNSRTNTRDSIGTGNLNRLGRISPDVDLQYQNWHIPRGVGISTVSQIRGKFLGVD